MQKYIPTVTTKSRNSEYTSFCARNSEKVWIDSEHSEHWLKILNRFWTFWTLTEHSEHTELWQNILNRFWTFWTFSEKSEQILNIVWKVWTDSEHCLNRGFKLDYNNYIILFLFKFDFFFFSIFLVKSIYFTSFSLNIKYGST